MTDRDLLELAAKAIGEHLSWLVAHKVAFIGDEPWNPLEDDGDALRLAVACSISIHWCSTGRVYAYTDGETEEVESSREDRARNLRRAIVRAAAAIGEVTP